MEILSLIFMIFMAIISFIFLPISFYTANKYKKILLSKLTNILPSIRNVTINDIHHFKNNPEFPNPLNIGILKILGNLKVNTISDLFNGITIEKDNQGLYIETGDINAYKISIEKLPNTDGLFEDCAKEPHPELIKLKKNDKSAIQENTKALIISDFLLDKNSGHLKPKEDSDFPMFVFLYDFDDSYLLNLLTMSTQKKTEISYILVFLFSFVLTPILSILLGIQNYNTSEIIGKILFSIAGTPFVLLAPPFTFILLKIIKGLKNTKIMENELNFYQPKEPYKEKTIEEALTLLEENPNKLERLKVSGKIVSYKKDENGNLMVFLLSNGLKHLAISAFNMKLRGFELIKNGIEEEEIYRKGEKVLYNNEEVNIYGCLRYNNENIPFMSTPDLSTTPLIVTSKKLDEIIEIKNNKYEKSKKNIKKMLILGLGIQGLILTALITSLFIFV